MSEKKHILRARSSTDLIAMVPYLVGYQPDHHVVIVGLDEATDRMKATACVPLLPAGSEDTDRLASVATARLAQAEVTGAYVVAYGDGTDATPQVDVCLTELRTNRIHIRDALRVADGRYWSYLCVDPDCCPPEGKPFDPAASALPAAATSFGLAPFPSRAALAESITPVQGAARNAMSEATATAKELINGAYAVASGRARDEHRRATYRFLRHAADRYANGDVIDDVQAAVLSVMLRDRRIRDEAVKLVAHEDTEAYIALWTDLARRAEPPYRVPVLTLLGFSSWRTGNASLANIAIEQATTAEPHYRLAQLLADALACGLNGRTVDVPKPTAQ